MAAQKEESPMFREEGRTMKAIAITAIICLTIVAIWISNKNK